MLGKRFPSCVAPPISVQELRSDLNCGYQSLSDRLCAAGPTKKKAVCFLHNSFRYLCTVYINYESGGAEIFGNQIKCITFEIMVCLSEICACLLTVLVSSVCLKKKCTKMFVL